MILYDVELEHITHLKTPNFTSRTVSYSISGVTLVDSTCLMWSRQITSGRFTLQVIDAESGAHP